MKYKYLKINGSFVWGEQVITKETLIQVKNRAYEALLNLEDMTQYDADTNEWKPIEGTADPATPESEE